MTTYESLIHRAETIYKAMKKAQDEEMKKSWYEQYHSLVNKAKSLTIEQAEEIVR